MIKNISRQQEILASRLRRCVNPLTRMKGLLGTSSLSHTEACWLSPCNSVHTIGMKYPLDLYFLNKKNEVVAIEKNVRPNRFSRFHFQARSVLEFATGERNCKIGDQLSIEG